MESIKAPWTQEQVNQLNRFQQLGFVHEFTCPNSHADRTLHATPNGWICPGCDYTQDWAHESMLHITEADNPIKKMLGPNA
jgi:hypothetical protein